MYKRIILSIVAIATISLGSFGQAPEGFKYQAVVRDAATNILASQAVGMRLVIKQGSPTGTTVYTETFATTTNAYGLVNLEIGSGTTVDDFTIIDWANGPFYLETAVDVTGGVSYVVMGTSQLMSVPYALYAKTAGSSAIDLVDDADADPANELQVLSFSNDTLYLSNGGSVYLGAYGIDTDSLNELQTLSINVDTLFISDGGYVLLPAGGAGDNDWTKVGLDMYATDANGSVSIGTTSFLQKVNIGDTGLFRMQVGHSGNFNEVESGRLVFTEDIEFNGTCGFEFHHDGAQNTLSLESGCTTLGDTSIVFTRTGEVRIPERVSIGVNSNPQADIHLEQSSSSTSPSSAGIRFYAPATTNNYWSLWNSTSDFSFGYNATRVSYINTAGTYIQVSDKRMKNSVVPIGSVLDRIMQLRPVEYNYNHDAAGHLSKGFIAQEVREIFPEMVSTSEGTDLLALPYDEFGVLAVKAIQEQQVIIEAQQRQIDEMKATLELLQRAIGVDNTPQETSVDPVINSTNANASDVDQK